MSKLIDIILILLLFSCGCEVSDITDSKGDGVNNQVTLTDSDDNNITIVHDDSNRVDNSENEENN